MERITVGQLASEFNVQSQVVINVLKRLGIFVAPSPNASVDVGLVERARKELQKQLQQAEQAAAPEPAKKPKRKEAKPKATAKAKGAAAEQAAIEAEPAKSLAPRKGRLKYTEYPHLVELEEKMASAKDPVSVVTEEAPQPEVQEVEKKPVRRRRRKTEEVIEEEKPAAQVEVPPQQVVVEEKPEASAEPGVREVAIEVPSAVEEGPQPPVEKFQPPPPQPPRAKTQILRQTLAEASETSVDISKHIIELPVETPPLKKTAERRPVAKRKVRDKSFKRAIPAAGPAVAVLKPEAAQAQIKTVTLTEGATVKELAEKLNIKAKDLIARLFNQGVLATINQTLDADTIKSLCAEFGYEANIVSAEEEFAEIEAEQDRPEDYVPRPPVVTIMGHVDHGKTTLLDAIRESRITEKEAGGITQHIGAYKVDVKDRSIVFLDTPGHEAFTMMRARGAQVTDVVVLVVAADDGVMPQTIEAIDHARAAGVPIIVAINKIDKPGVDLMRVKQQLTEHGLMPEEWGGDTVTVEISAKNRMNIDLLLEMILLVADLKELKANPKRLASGTILEARLDRTRGPVATVLVQNGTLHVGDCFLAGAVYGKVRAMLDDRGRSLKEAPPSTPVEVLGFEGVPQAGDKLIVVNDIEKAKKISLYRQAIIRERTMRRTARLTLDQLYEQMKQGKVKELPIILKADVQGSVEAITDLLEKLSGEKVKIKILHSGTGAITETDVLLASASNAIIIGFNVRPERKAAELAEQENVDIRLHRIIYEVADEIKKAMVGLLEHTVKERHLGSAEVRQTFRIPKVGTVAGAYVSDGVIRRGAQVRLLRDNVVVYEGKIASLKRFKDDVEEVRSGYECGIGLEKFNDIKIGDVIEAFVVEKIQPTLSQL